MSLKSLSSSCKNALYIGALVLIIYPTPFYRLFVPIVSGTRMVEPLTESADVIEKLDNPSKFELERQHHSYILRPRKKYQVYGRIIDIDRYHGLWEKFAHDYDNGRMIYNALSPLDLVIGHGQMADKDFLKNFEFKHEYRLMWWKPLKPIEYTSFQHLFNNYHIIPATPRIALATRTLMRGDMIFLKGLLVDVKSPDYTWCELSTGGNYNEWHKEFYGGQYATKCFILYVQELRVNNYLYK